MDSKPTFDKKRPLSWSAISSFEYDPEQWHRKYVLGQPDPETKEMRFGKEVGERIASDPSFLPALSRRSIFEYEMRCMFGKIPLIGFADSYEPHTDLDEYKTGKKAWDQKLADTHGQFDMYLLELFLIDKVKPEDVRLRLHWMPTIETGDFRIMFRNPHEPEIFTFETQRTMKDVLRFGQRITKTYKAMEEYAKNHD